MLLWLEGEASNIEADIRNPLFKEALRNICASVRCGVHVLGGDRNYLLQICAQNDISPEVEAVLRRSSQLLSQDGVRLDRVAKVRINQSYGEVVSAGDDWYVPLAIFTDPRVCERPKILVENLTDYNVYLGFARSYVDYSIGSFELSLQALNGGGDTTADVLIAEIQNHAGRLLCVVDSDRKMRHENPKQTARRCIEVFMNFQDRWRVDLTVLDARELENLIPPALRETACSKLDPLTRDRLGELMGLAREVAAHICLKKGDRLCRFYVAGILVCEAANDAISCAHCGKGRGCSDTPVLGDRFLRHVADVIKAVGHPIDNQSQWEPELLAVIKKVAYLGLSRSISRVA